MKKEVVLVIFSTIQRGMYYIEDNILPLVGDLKRLNSTTYYTDRYELIVSSFNNMDKLRGLSPSLVFLDDYASMDSYNFILELVRGEHRKIKVVV